MSSCIVHCVAASVVKILDCCSVRRVFCRARKPRAPGLTVKVKPSQLLHSRNPVKPNGGNSEILLQHRIWSERRPVLLDPQAEVQGTRADRLLLFG